jgi:hypothetical protein
MLDLLPAGEHWSNHPYSLAPLGGEDRHGDQVLARILFAVKLEVLALAGLYARAVLHKVIPTSGASGARDAVEAEPELLDLA